MTPPFPGNAGREELRRVWLLACEWTPEGSQANPFLHMGLHVALRELSDRLARTQDAHAGEHLLMECLAETLWEAERAGLPPDESAFLARARRATGG